MAAGCGTQSNSPFPRSRVRSSDTLQIRKRKSRVGALELWPHLSPRVLCVRPLAVIPSPGATLPFGGTDGVRGADSPPQAVPGHDWHIFRSQEMLCTAPAVIKHGCFPAAPQRIPKTPNPPALTYLPLHHVNSRANTPNMQPHLKRPIYPQTHFYHIFYTHSPTFATHSHFIVTAPKLPTSRHHVHTHTLNLPRPPAHVLAHPQVHTQRPSPLRYTLAHTSTHGQNLLRPPTPLTLSLN